MVADIPQRRTCGTMNVHRRLLNTDPAYVAAREASENYTFAYARQRGLVTRTGITVIPVVVHVVYNPNSPEQNISHEQIRSQIDVLNRDFRMRNSDVASVPSAFQSLVADARIEFELVTTDPSGNPTNGITRTATTATSFTDDDRVKSAATGGADPWPAERYLNIWVCLLGGGLLGYAQFPGGPAATDGVVITHTGFGTTGTATAPFNLGRTASHEIGHWLNLRHIWGDDGSGCHGSDFVDDTPNQAGSNTGIPTFPHVTCDNGPNGDMFMNYMDYTDDAGMFMFTTGQVTRMHAALEHDRPGIGSRPTWQRFELSPSGSASGGGSATAVSRVPNSMEVWWIGANGSVQDAFWYEGSQWQRFELAPAGSASTNRGITAVSRIPNSMEVWWIGSDGSVQGAFWYEGSQWQRFELAPAGSASTNGGVAAVSRVPNSMEVWWIGANGSVQDAFWYE